MRNYITLIIVLFSHSIFAQGVGPGTIVNDPTACTKLAEQLATMKEKLAKLTAMLGVSEETLEKADKIKDYTKNVQEWIGDAKEYTVDKVDELVGIDNIVAVQEAGVAAIETGKAGYEVYQSGKSLYDTGAGIYKMFEQKDMNIQNMASQLKTLSEDRENIMNMLKVRTMNVGGAKDQAKIMKEQTAIQTATVKMLANQAQETSQTNALILQQMQDANSKEAAVTKMREDQAVSYSNYNSFVTGAVNVVPGSETGDTASEDDWFDK